MFQVMLLILYGVVACVKPSDFSEIELEDSAPTLAFPLVEATITSDELVEAIDTSITVVLNDDGLFAMQFSAEPYVENAEVLFPKLTIDLPIPILDSMVSLPVPSFDGFQISTGVLKGDQMSFILNSTELSKVDVSIQIPQLSKGNDPFLGQYTVPAATFLPGSLTTDPINLNGYEVDFSSGNLSLRYQAINDMGDKIILPLSFVIVNAFDFSYLEGKLSQTRLNTGLQEIDIDIRDTTLDGDIQFQDPKIHFDISNSFGVPVGLQVNRVYLVNHSDESAEITSALFDDLVLIESPDFDEIGSTVTQRITLDRTNSNVLEVASTDIKDLFYDIDIVLNPDTEDEVFFVTDSSKAQIDALVDLSFDATVQDLRVERVLDVSLDGLDTLDFLRLKMYVENEVPLAVSPELQFGSSSSSDIWVLEADDQKTIEAATLDANGSLVVSQVSELYFTLTAEELVQLENFNILTAILYFDSPGDGTDATMLRPNQRVFIGVGAEAGLK